MFVGDNNSIKDHHGMYCTVLCVNTLLQKNHANGCMHAGVHR